MNCRHALLLSRAHNCVSGDPWMCNTGKRKHSGLITSAPPFARISSRERCMCACVHVCATPRHSAATDRIIYVHAPQHAPVGIP
eukprot:609916-Pyramimonas_sp.AAC.2